MRSNYLIWRFHYVVCVCVCVCVSYHRMVSKLERNAKESTLAKLETLSQDTSRGTEMKRESSLRTPGVQRGI